MKLSDICGLFFHFCTQSTVLFGVAAINGICLRLFLVQPHSVFCSLDCGSRLCVFRLNLSISTIHKGGIKVTQSTGLNYISVCRNLNMPCKLRIYFNECLHFLIAYSLAVLQVFQTIGKGTVFRNEVFSGVGKVVNGLFTFFGSSKLFFKLFSLFCGFVNGIRSFGCNISAFFNSGIIIINYLLALCHFFTICRHIVHPGCCFYGAVPVKKIKALLILGVFFTSLVHFPLDFFYFFVCFFSGFFQSAELYLFCLLFNIICNSRRKVIIFTR